MKIFATSDIHGNLELINLLINEVIKKEQIDVLIIAGDIAPKGFDASYTFSEIKLEQKRGVEKICKSLQETKIPVFMMIGNDDHISGEDWTEILKKYNVLNLNMT
ncbi:MAG: metallophosphoesterase, partial [Candidatus Margulisbacteria bacterium]|nr:metallophosphoesterase [Candidatus Margulisiibacteriota bacterium]